MGVGSRWHAARWNWKKSIQSQKEQYLQDDSLPEDGAGVWSKRCGTHHLENVDIVGVFVLGCRSIRRRLRDIPIQEDSCPYEADFRQFDFQIVFYGDNYNALLAIKGKSYLNYIEQNVSRSRSWSRAARQTVQAFADLLIASRGRIVNLSSSASVVNSPWVSYAAFNPDGTGALPPMEGSEDSYIAVIFMLAHPLSRGSVQVTDAGAGQTLAIDPGFLSHPLDLEIMARHVQFIEQGPAVAEPLAKWWKPDGNRAVGAPEAGALRISR
ncbi:hypothetical protein F4818DRAFT_442899 [Hypoxylon cercidicola]|nr:hypothetical protein F4818DRAFT_442899 [Hypoxylon cercidicola]